MNYLKKLILDNEILYTQLDKLIPIKDGFIDLSIAYTINDACKILDISQPILLKWFMSHFPSEPYQIRFFHKCVWYKNDKVHRDNDKPAEIWDNSSQFWYQNGLLHRDNDKPAAIYSDGYQAWYKDGERHRDGGPAIITDDGSKSWYQFGERHRDDGPAIIWDNGRREWYKNGIKIW